MNKFYGFIYITTNNINGMKYIGQCSGDPDTPSVKRYFGSGKSILAAIRKYGAGNFSKEIVAFASSLEELNMLERKLISEHDAVKSRKYYNIATGGRASMGFSGKKHTVERNEKLSRKMLNDGFKHHNAKSVKIGDSVYKSKSQAKKCTGYSAGKLEKFISTGIHPNEQQHGGKGNKKMYLANDKVWYFIEQHTGNLVEITKLNEWCKKHKTSSVRMVATKDRNVFHLGLKFSHSEKLRRD